VDPEALNQRRTFTCFRQQRPKKCDKILSWILNKKNEKSKVCCQVNTSFENNKYKGEIEDLLFVRGNKGLELLLGGTNELLDLRAVLVEVEGGHGRDAKTASQIGNLVNVDLQENNIGVLSAEKKLVSVRVTEAQDNTWHENFCNEHIPELLNEGSNALARAAPGGEEVHNNQLRASVLKIGIELPGRGNVLDRHG
jgi:hypothetical protein